jgi:phosphoserine phosphatase
LAGEPPARLWAYGNSSGDAELLAAAHEPTWVGKRARQQAGSS